VKLWTVIPVQLNRLLFHPMESLLSLHPRTKRADYEIYQQRSNAELWKAILVMSNRLCFSPDGKLVVAAF